MSQLDDELNKMFDEMDVLMDKLPGNIKRIKNCTLKEQWRHEGGRSFDDIDQDNDYWGYTYEVFEAPTEDSMNFFIENYMKPCSLTELVVATKYPTVHQQIKKLGGWK